MGFREEFKQDVRNGKNEDGKYLAIDFEGHGIEIYNTIMEEILAVDGQIIDRHARKSGWSSFLPYSTLSGTFQGVEGNVHTIHVKIGGFMRPNITVKIDRQVLLQEAAMPESLSGTYRGKIVPYIEQQVQAHGKVIDADLPDDLDYGYDEDGQKLAPGWTDRLFADFVTAEYAKMLFDLFMKQVKNPTKKNRKAAYEKISGVRVIKYYTELMEFYKQAEKVEEHVQQEALWMLEHAAHREVVKFALVMLGSTNCEAYKERLQTIALHEEFTGFASFALKNGTRNGNNYIWQLAKTVKGWGKIDALKFLEPETEEIRLWFLTEGTKNDILNSHSSVVCAEKGRLDTTLNEREISRQLFIGATEIIEGLLSEEGYMPIYGYDFAGQVFMRYVYHAKVHCQEPADFYMLARISDYMNEDEIEWDNRYRMNWTPRERHATEELLREIVRNSKWVRWAFQVLQAEEPDISQALAIAEICKGDFQPLLFDKLQKEPNRIEYHRALAGMNERQVMEALLAFTDRFASLDDLTDEEKETVIVLVRALGRFVGMGLPFIERNLRSADTSLQHIALTTLSKQDKIYWHTPEIAEAVKTVAKASKDRENRRLAKSLL